MFGGPTRSTRTLPTLPEALAGHCFSYDHWLDFQTAMSDPLLPQSEKDRWACWANHYLNECAPSCGYSACSGTDPFGGPCGRH